MALGAQKFDRYADEYERLHAESVAWSGEGTDYFAEHKLECLVARGVARDARILDFGCGIGNLTTKLANRFQQVVGYEPSAKSAELAESRAPGVTVHQQLAGVPEGHFDVVVVSCVLHHVEPSERLALLEQARLKLRAGGRLFVFEHNPLNPLTRRAVAACEFDDDAVLLWPWQAKALLKRAGLSEVSLDYIVFFPKPLGFLRRFEARLAWLPAGAQQLIVGTKR